MAGLYIHRSNRLEALAAELAQVTATPLADPLQEEMIVVQSLGMRRWISFELASRLGITMNCAFPFLQEFAQRALGGARPSSAFRRQILPWRILTLLPTLLRQPSFEALTSYAGDSSLAQARRFQLAQQIATVFDRYLGYDPERLLRWESEEPGADASWQSRLWRELTREHADHPPARLRALRDQPDSLGGPDLPPRLSVFGVSAVAPFYLHLFPVVARWADVHLFLLEPTDQYWGDILSSKEQGRALRRAGEKWTAEDLHFEEGNPLLASLGKPGRMFAREIQELLPHASQEFFSPPTGPSLLSRVQRDIFEVNAPGGVSPTEREEIAAPDHSIQIHACHGRWRELQVLKDQLLHLFETLPGLMPKDVLVTMPDVEPYAPMIEAIFAQAEAEELRIPFSIADRSARVESALVRALLLLLDFPGSRYGLSTVLALLELKAVRDRFGIAESDLDLLGDWTRSAGVRWGIDGEHRAGFDLPEFTQNSWRAGLDRMLLGTALAGNGLQLFDGVLPMEEIEGSDSVLLGRFVEFCERLFALQQALEAPRTLSKWETALRTALESFVADTGELAPEWRKIRAVLRELGEAEEWHPHPLSLELLRSHLQSVLAASESGLGFLTGRVTFCSMKPMRSVPFRVLCVLGLDGDDFPRHEAQLGFDLLAAANGGARWSRRDDDRQLFLETILSARDALYLSYCGLSARDNSELPPSVVVSELLEYVSLHYRGPGDAASALSVTPHPLQPFSPRYFTPESSLFSYSETQCRSSRVIAGARPELSGSAPELLPEPPEQSPIVSLTELLAFFKNPAKDFISQQLQARLLDREDEIEDCEPFDIDSLDRWQWQARLTAPDAPAIAELLEAARAAGQTPAASAADMLFEKMRKETSRLLEVAATLRSGPPHPPEKTLVRCGAWELEGALESVYATGLVEVSGWRMRPKDRLRAWILHLFHQAASIQPPTVTHLLTTDSHLVLQPVEDPHALLADLLALRASGRRRPLPFFEKSSFKFACTVINGKSTITAWHSTRSDWTADFADAYVERCFHPENDRQSEEWQQIALRIWTPLLRASQESNLA